jgi:hypothetical protein
MSFAMAYPPSIPYILLFETSSVSKNLYLLLIRPSTILRKSYVPIETQFKFKCCRSISFCRKDLAKAVQESLPKRFG